MIAAVISDNYVEDFGLVQCQTLMCYSLLISAASFSSFLPLCLIQRYLKNKCCTTEDRTAARLVTASELNLIHEFSTSDLFQSDSAGPT